VEHLTLMEDDVLKFDFLGKDSIRYYNEVKVDHRVSWGQGLPAD
jgi:DNA topoisomerase-1